MHFKLLIAFVEDSKTDKVIAASRKAGATGCTVINHARGEGLKQAKTFLGLNLDAPSDALFFLVEEHLSRDILEAIAEQGDFINTGTGIAFQVDVEDAVGILHQVQSLENTVEDKI